MIHLDGQDSEGLTRWLRQRGWIQPDEAVTAVASAGAGNMNLTLRLAIGDRSVILKQSRPWVERYPQIAAPEVRALVEAAFYEAASHDEAVAGRMPRLLEVDAEDRVLLLEDLGTAADCTDVYAGAPLGEGVREELLDWAGALHRLDAADAGGRLRNHPMRALNHEHMFDLPLRPGALNADDFEPGLEEHAAALRGDAAYVAAVRALGGRYLEDGPSLLHGDFYPGSWLRTADGVRVIDPEFCFRGPPEFDLGVMFAHAVFAGATPDEEEAAIACGYAGPPGIDVALMRRFAGVELMRRLIGVAQLPLRADLQQRASWLGQSRRWVLG